MKYLFLLICLVSCLEKPVSTSKTNNENIKVELLFEHDGCKVYRFNDGDYRYYAVCSGQATTNWDEDCGDDGNGNRCTRHQQLPTRTIK